MKYCAFLPSLDLRICTCLLLLLLEAGYTVNNNSGTKRCKTFTKTHYMLHYKVSLNTFQRTDIILSAFSDCSGIKLLGHQVKPFNSP